MSYEMLIYEKQDHIATVTINRDGRDMVLLFVDQHFV